MSEWRKRGVGSCFFNIFPCGRGMAVVGVVVVVGKNEQEPARDLD